MVQHSSPVRSDKEDSAISCRVAGHFFGRVSAEQIFAFRHRPGRLPPGRTMSPAILRYSDEQTVVGLAGVLRVLEDMPVPAEELKKWGVLSGPSFFGRKALTQALERYEQEGAWGINPHLVPHHSLHGLSGTISLALGLHGLNLGVGGGPEPTAEALRVAASFLEAELAPGIWVVLSGTDPEFIPGIPNDTSKPTWLVVVLALVPDLSTESGLRIRVGPEIISLSDLQGANDSPLPSISLKELGARLESLTVGPARTWNSSKSEPTELAA